MSDAATYQARRPPAGVALERVLELDLVLDGNAVRAGFRQLRLELARLGHRVAVEPDPLPARALVEADRVGVVVRGDEPEPLPPVFARVVDDRVEQRATGTCAAIGRDDHDE